MSKEKIMDWMNKGAQPTDTVRNLLTKNGTMKKFADAKAAKTVKAEAQTEVKAEVKAETKAEANEAAPAEEKAE